MKIKKKYVIIGSSIIIALLSLYFVITGITGQFVTPEGAYDNFAKCLTEKGVVMYGSVNCGHCKAQKDIFGDSFQFVNYVECTEQMELCQQKRIEAVPTWEIDGTFYTGQRSLEELSELSGCPLE